MGIVGSRWVVVVATASIAAVVLSGCGQDAYPKVVENPAWEAATSAAGPRAVFRETEVDVGRVSLNTWVQYRYTLRNSGDQTLRVLEPPGIEVLEGCCPPTPLLRSDVLAPGEQTDLTIRTQMHAGMDGAHLFRITVQTNDPREPQQSVLFRGDFG